MAKYDPDFRPIIGERWNEVTSDDPLILNELKRLGLNRYLRPSKKDLTMYGTNKRLVLCHLTGQAILVWEQQPFLMGTRGIKCVLFVNNSKLSSDVLLMEAMKLARASWIESPFFVDLESTTQFPLEASSIFEKCGWSLLSGLQHRKYPIYTSSFGSLPLWRTKSD